MNLSFLSPFLYPGAILATLISLARPRVGIYFLVFVLPLQTLRSEIQSYPFGGSIIDIVLLGVLLGAWSQRSEPLFADVPMKKLLFCSFAYWYISLWHGSLFLGLPWPISIDDLRFSYWKSYVELGLIAFVVFAAIRTKAQVRAVLVTMCVSALLISYDFFQVVSAQDLSHFTDSARYAGVLGYAGVNGLAAFVAYLALFLASMVSFKVDRRLRTLAVFALIACVYCVLFAFSRGAYMAFAVGLLAMALLKRRFILVLGLAALLGGVMLLPGSVRERISGTYVQAADSSDQTLDSSAEERVVIWQDALAVFRAFPLTGTGFQTYQFMHRSLGYGDTHNFYLKVLVEQGIIGLIFFLLILGRMFAQGVGLFHSTEDPFLSALGLGFAGCIVGAAVANIFGDRWSYMQVDAYVWVLLALVWRGRLLAQTAEDESVVMESAEEEMETYHLPLDRVPLLS